LIGSWAAHIPVMICHTACSAGDKSSAGVAEEMQIPTSIAQM